MALSHLTEPALVSWGRALGEAVVAGDVVMPLVIALRGPLGAGKSVLARSIARGAGVTGHMPSPTYNLLFTYSGESGLEVLHLDLYRLDDPDDVWELGWRDLAEGDRLVLIEWPERAESLLPEDRWDVFLDPVEGDPELRILRLIRQGDAPPPPSRPGDEAA